MAEDIGAEIEEELPLDGSRFAVRQREINRRANRRHLRSVALLRR
jgi:hypothetical protein